MSYSEPDPKYSLCSFYVRHSDRTRRRTGQQSHVVELLCSLGFSAVDVADLVRYELSIFAHRDTTGHASIFHRFAVDGQMA